MSGGKITKSGKKIFLNRTYKGTPDYAELTVFKAGTGVTAVTVDDTDLENPIPIQTTTETVDDFETADWTDSADVTSTLNAVTFKEGSKSLALAKDATASATITINKTTTSRDFTGKDFSIWIYIIDATMLAKLAVSTCLSIRFGSDSSNYYEWEKDLADLAVGWNLIDGLTSANADTTTGTPSLAAMDYTYVEFVATGSAIVWSAGDLLVDDSKLISADDYIKTFESGYPALDETALSSTIRCRISSVQSNGYPITEVGLFNEDGTPLMESRDTMTAISKSNTDELIFIIKNEII